MKILQLIDHTPYFKSSLINNNTSQETSLNNDIFPPNTVVIDMNKENEKTENKKITDQLDLFLRRIDDFIENIHTNINSTYDFSTSIKEQCVNFTECTNNVNVLSNQFLTIIKKYEKSDPLIYRHYVLAIKERLQKMDDLAIKFKQSDIIAKELFAINSNSNNNIDNCNNDNYDDNFGTTQLMQKNIDFNIEQRITQREIGINNIYQSLNYLHQNFLDVLMLVADQGEAINSIDDSIIKSLDYTNKGVSDLRIANIYNNKNNNLKCKILIFIIIVGIICVLLSYFLR